MNLNRAKNHLFEEERYINSNNSTGSAVVECRTFNLCIFEFLFKNNAFWLLKYFKIMQFDKIFSLRINIVKFVNENLVETLCNSVLILIT